MQIEGDEETNTSEILLFVHIIIHFVVVERTSFCVGMKLSFQFFVVLSTVVVGPVLSAEDVYAADIGQYDREACDAC